MNDIFVQLRELLLAHQRTLPVLLTLGAYTAGVSLHRVGRCHALLNPTLLAIIIVVVMLLTLHIDYSAYFAAAQPIHLLFGPAVVALVVPLYRHLGLIRERALLLMVPLVVGSLSAIGSSVAIGFWLGATRQALLSFAPKSATTAVSMAVSA